MKRGLLAGVLAAAVAVFVWLAAAYVDGGSVVSFDVRTAEWVAREMPGWAEWAARPFTWVGGWAGLTAVGLLAALLLRLVPRRLHDVSFLLLTGVGVGVLTGVLKSVFERARPDEGSAIPLPHSYSFPSGHASGSVALLGGIAVLVAERLPRRRDRILALAAAAALAGCIAASRVILNVHYVSDVIAGYALGVAWLSLCLLVRAEVDRRSARFRHEAVTPPTHDPG